MDVVVWISHSDSAEKDPLSCRHLFIMLCQNELEKLSHAAGKIERSQNAVEQIGEQILELDHHALVGSHVCRKHTTSPHRQSLSGLVNTGNRGQLDKLPILCMSRIYSKAQGADLVRFLMEDRILDKTLGQSRIIDRIIAQRDPIHQSTP